MIAEVNQWNGQLSRLVLFLYHLVGSSISYDYVLRLCLNYLNLYKRKTQFPKLAVYKHAIFTFSVEGPILGWVISNTSTPSFLTRRPLLSGSVRSIQVLILQRNSHNMNKTLFKQIRLYKLCKNIYL